MISLSKAMRFLCLFLLVFVLGSCKDDTTGVVATSIEIDMSQVATTVAIGTFDLSDVILIVTYSDNSVQHIAVTPAMIQNFNQGLLDTAGVHTFTVRYSGLTAQFVIDLVDASQLLVLPELEILDNFSFSLSVTFDGEDYEIILKRDGSNYIILDEDALLNQARIYSYHDGALQQAMIQHYISFSQQWPDCWNRMSSPDSTELTDEIESAISMYLDQFQVIMPTSINLAWFTLDNGWYTLKSAHYSDMNAVLENTLSTTIELSGLRFSLTNNQLRYELSSLQNSSQLDLVINYGHIGTTVIDFPDFDVCLRYAFDYIDLSTPQDAYLLSKYYGYDQSVIINIMEKRMNLTHIGTCAFMAARNLEEIGIPATVLNIGDEAFKDNPLLEIVYVETITPPVLGINVFSNTSSNLIIYVPEESLAIYKSAPGWSAYSNHIFSGIYPTPTKFFISYDPNIDDVSSSMTLVDYNTLLIEPQEPIKLGYTFLGWFEEDAVDPYVFNKMPAHDIYLEARYEQVEYTVSFVAPEVDPIADHHHYYDDVLNLPIPQLDDHTFEGWYEDDDFTIPFTSDRMLDRHLTLYAKFSRIENTLAYYSQTQVNPTSIITYGHSIYILTENHRLLVWGRNSWGELGLLDNHFPYNDYEFNPIDITDSFELDSDEWIESIHVGLNRAFAMTSKGNVYAFGLNNDCLLGFCDEYTTFPISITKPINITDVFNLGPQEKIIMNAVGSHHNLMISSEGRLFAWGDDYHGSLGFTPYSSIGSPSDFTDSFLLNQGETITQIYSGSYHNMVVTSQHRVLAWGYNAHGQLGDGTTNTQQNPVDITQQFSFMQGETIADIKLYLNQSLVITTHGRVFTFGHNNVGQLGVGHKNDVLVPYDLTPSLMLHPQELVTTATLGQTHGLLLTSLGRVMAWGSNYNGQLGNGSTEEALVPIDISSSVTISTNDFLQGISVGSAFSILFTDQGTVFAFGHSSFPFLYGTPTIITSYYPYDITHRFMIHSLLSSDVTPSQTLLITGEPNRAGHTFEGWYEDKDLTVPLSQTHMPEHALKLYAKWTRNTYTVTFEPNGGTPELGVITHLYGTYYELPILEKEGSIFSGWYMDAQLTSPLEVKTYYQFIGWDNDDPILEAVDYIYWPESDMTLYAEWVLLVKYTVTFEDHDGSMIRTEMVSPGDPAIPPSDPYREGYTFIGWDSMFDTVISNMTVVAQYTINTYLTIYYEEDGVTIIQSTSYEYGEDLSDHVEPGAPEKEGYTFGGWIALPATMPAGDVTRVASYIFDGINLIDLVQVGETDTTYTIPIWTDDSGTATVEGGYLMTTTQTTYELWYEVRIWAEVHGYHFQNQGREGSHGIGGATPTASKLEPVTYVSWRDTIVWLNALSEMSGLNPVYRTSGGAIIKDSRNANAWIVDAAIQTSSNGYRLPTSYEWEMAARWKDDTESTHASILVGGRYWTPGWYASGATANYTNEAETQLVAWYRSNSDSKTQLVGQLLPNHLGIYDMSGNVWEWTYNTSEYNRVVRGACWYSTSVYMQVGYVASFHAATAGSNIGFRFVRNLEETPIIGSTVTFEDHDGTLLKTETVQDGHSAIAPDDPERVGYTFIGWDIPFDNVTSDLTVVAHYTINQYTITFYSAGGTQVDAITQDYDSDITAPEDPSKDGYSFLSWNPSVPAKMPAGNVTLTAQWEDDAPIEASTVHYGIVTDSYDVNLSIPLHPGEKIIGLSIGGFHSSALTSEGRVFIWGANWWGQLGDDTNTNKSTPTEITNYFILGKGETIISLSLGWEHSSALTSNGRVFTWGYNQNGRLGDGTTTIRSTPTDITNQFLLNQGETIINISLGLDYSSALTSNGRVFTWGQGNSTPTDITSHFSLNTGETIICLSLGLVHSSVLTSEGRVFTWGNNVYGQLGDGTTINRLTPIDITSQFSLDGGETIIIISIGGYHSAVFTSEGRVFTWGRNNFGQLGDGTTMNKIAPTEITSHFNLGVGETIIRISFEEFHSSALTSEDRVFTWGYNGAGRLGDGTNIDKSIPTEITSHFNLSVGDTIINLSLGGHHSSAITSEGHVITWGSNGFGQLGDSTTTSNNTPTVLLFYYPTLIHADTYDYNDIIIEHVPVLENHTFSGWYSDIEMINSYVFSTMPEENVYLYGYWIEND